VRSQQKVRAASPCVDVALPCRLGRETTDRERQRELRVTESSRVAIRKYHGRHREACPLTPPQPGREGERASLRPPPPRLDVARPVPAKDMYRKVNQPFDKINLVLLPAPGPPWAAWQGSHGHSPREPFAREERAAEGTRQKGAQT
jgi:hypothetical protein